MVTRADLTPPVQACQAVHAALAHAAAGHQVPETLALLAAPDELALYWLCADAQRASLAFTTFHEPDLGDSLTAVALEPGAARLCRKFPLALFGVHKSHHRVTCDAGEWCRCTRGGGELDDNHD